MSVSLGAAACLSAKAKKILALSRVLQNWNHRSLKKLQWHLAEQLLFLVCCCESGYIIFHGFLRTKLMVYKKLNLFFLRKRKNKLNESLMSRVRWISAWRLWQRFPEEEPQVKNPRVLQRSSRCRTRQCLYRVPISKLVIRLLQGYLLLKEVEVNIISELCLPTDANTIQMLFP